MTGSRKAIWMALALLVTAWPAAAQSSVYYQVVYTDGKVRDLTQLPRTNKGIDRVTRIATAASEQGGTVFTVDEQGMDYVSQPAGQTVTTQMKWNGKAWVAPAVAPARGSQEQAQPPRTVVEPPPAPAAPVAPQSIEIFVPPATQPSSGPVEESASQPATQPAAQPLLQRRGPSSEAVASAVLEFPKASAAPAEPGVLNDLSAQQAGLQDILGDVYITSCPGKAGRPSKFQWGFYMPNVRVPAKAPQ